MPALLEPPAEPVETNQLFKGKKTSYIPFSWESADENEYCLDEPPAWHAVILEERAEEMKRCKELGRDIEEVFNDLLAKSRGR